MIKTVAFVLVLWSGPYISDKNYPVNARQLSHHDTEKECDNALSDYLDKQAEFRAKDDTTYTYMSCQKVTRVVIEKLGKPKPPEQPRQSWSEWWKTH